jgi:RNA polymerase sigma-70 factor (ECF subfamily)
MDPKREDLLLEAACKGDEAAFLTIFEKYKETVFRFAYRMVGSETIAQDITQDCFLNLLHRRVRLNGSQSSLKSFFYGTVRNMARRHFRKTGSEIPIDKSEELSVPTMNDHNLYRQEISKIIQQAVARLPLPQREVFLLFEYEDLPYEEIARILETDSGSVKSRLFRARENLRRMLAPHNPLQKRG